jgi:hypothetical protein
VNEEFDSVIVRHDEPSAKNHVTGSGRGWRTPTRCSLCGQRKPCAPSLALLNPAGGPHNAVFVVWVSARSAGPPGIVLRRPA